MYASRNGHYDPDMDSPTSREPIPYAVTESGEIEPRAHEVDDGLGWARGLFNTAVFYAALFLILVTLAMYGRCVFDAVWRRLP